MDSRPAMKFSCCSGKVSKSLTFLFYMAIAIVAMIPCLQGLDGEISTKLRSIDWRGDPKKIVDLWEFFAHGFGAIVILGTLWWIDLRHRREIASAALFTLSVGLLANGLKYFIPRIRPLADSNGISTDNWLPFFYGSFWDSTQRSFPSGHSATAVALAIGLSCVYPRGSFLFAVYAALACLQRVISGSHFPSDVLAGVAIALGCAAVYVARKPSSNT
jgi:membrane-associated phospholipid phosphatase